MKEEYAARLLSIILSFDVFPNTFLQSHFFLPSFFHLFAMVPYTFVPPHFFYFNSFLTFTRHEPASVHQSLRPFSEITSQKGLAVRDHKPLMSSASSQARQAFQ
uniref:(northern house mosquito) hypothetical protein n=1 Tax=Culex pipiens TaxID=7175 RepID=A0A8D8H1Z0_CULPI